MACHRHSLKDKTTAGFTLLELLVVLAILGLITTVVLVALPGSRESLELKTAARDVMMQMTDSRSQAIRTHGEVRFFVDISQNEFWTEDFGPSRKLPAGIVLEIHTAKGELEDNNRAAIRFFPDGSSTGGYVRLSGDAGVYRIAVNWLTGKIVMEHDTEQE